VGKMRRTIRRSSCARGIGESCFRSLITWGLFNRYRDRYDFDLATGKSETGLRACVYEIRVKQAESDGEAEVWVEAPRGGTGWQLVNLRPVSEGKFGIIRNSGAYQPVRLDFADPPPNPTSRDSTSPPPQPTDIQTPQEPVVPEVDPPTTLVEWAVLILNTPDPTLKVSPPSLDGHLLLFNRDPEQVERTRYAVKLFQTGGLKTIGHKMKNAPTPPDVPPRNAQYARKTIDRGKSSGRKSKGATLHALANIEQWA